MSQGDGGELFGTRPSKASTMATVPTPLVSITPEYFFCLLRRALPQPVALCRCPTRLGWICDTQPQQHKDSDDTWHHNKAQPVNELFTLYAECYTRDKSTCLFMQKKGVLKKQSWSQHNFKLLMVLIVTHPMTLMVDEGNPTRNVMILLRNSDSAIES